MNNLKALGIIRKIYQRNEEQIENVFGTSLIVSGKERDAIGARISSIRLLSLDVGGLKVAAEKCSIVELGLQLFKEQSYVPKFEQLCNL